MSSRGGRGVSRGRLVSGRGSGGQRNFNSSNKRNKRKDLKCYPHRTGTDQQTEAFTKVKEYLILNIQSEFMNGSDIAESICKG